MQDPLAANAPSSPVDDGPFCRCNESPPSDVVRITNRPSTGSPTTTPCMGSQNAIASQKPFGSPFVKTSDQLAPPSRVLYNRDPLPDPALRRIAVRSSKAC